MCQLSRIENDPAAAEENRTDHLTPAFSCQRLNSTTFVVQENDKWSEEPLIYVKTYPHDIVLIDSGCGGSSETPTIDLTLKVYLETVPVPDNEGLPLNRSGVRPYTIISTHCHYDHIGGIPEFMRTSGLAVWASSAGKDFLTDPHKLNSASLCAFIGMELPRYHVTHWAEDGARVVSSSGQDLNLVVFQTPGHMPDEIAIWDAKERVLFVGDTVYERAPILFPEGGSISEYRDTIDRLQQLVHGWNEEEKVNCGKVTIASGHITKSADAARLLAQTGSFVSKVLASEASVEDLGIECSWFGGKPAVQFKDGEEGITFQGLKTSFEGLV
ncbi:conserved hypothetical protein [Verticillium alfalfae VaMs.102]|uniref:Metallo-beta-lactamase domain-containing protein n=1 Tax=Verticillium alfalfae (strain VaMs.102 / ATCC MYA-4576 / FGSC 10136) TaxID=526221 RepID=C9SRP3_VERA1|nr:conserved hypothetical protein [Verticillium alfalfae VaMs.102]EEY21458.1 conserved hypothetical protein [Verticillium alfalfae VaMs.102]